MKRPDKGQLKIFFSYAESIGKTEAMLKAGIKAKKEGIDVVAGYIASNRLINDEKLSDKLEFINKDTFDLDSALERNPELILIDELGYTNSDGSRHKKRFQDVDELLKQGMNVYTTVNVGNIESLHDTVASITGIATWDRIPDSVFDNADQVELIDIEPQELMERLQESGTADSQFTLAQLTALREVALRRCADRVRRLSDKLQEKNAFHTDEHILACLSSAPSNAKIIRTAAKMAKAFNGQFTALFVETPDFAAATPENKKRLIENRKLAEQLGANIETVYGEDVPYQIAEFARLSGITKVVLGRSAMTRKHLLGKPTLTEQLLTYAPEMDIHIIPDKSADNPYKPKSAKKRHILLNSLKSIGILSVATGLSLLFYEMSFTESNIILVYILGVLITSIVTSHQVYSLISSIASVIIFNFLFTQPRFSLMAYGTGYPVTFIVMFLTAYITGTFAIRYKAQAAQSVRNAYRTKLLFDTNQLLSKANNKEEIFMHTAGQVQKLLDRDIVLFENIDGKLSEPTIIRTKYSEMLPYHKESEMEAAEWVLLNNHAAGATTDTHSQTEYLYLALRMNEKVYGVIGIYAKNSSLEASEYGILLSILGEAALALENDRNHREKEAAAILAESEQLRANLLRTISHDLRTPLTTISGNANILMNNGHKLDDETKKEIYSDIYNDSLWLTGLVENLLYSTRIEAGKMSLSTQSELINEIIEEAVEHIRRKAIGYNLTVSDDELILVKADAKLIVQVITNIVDNALKYTPKGSEITIAAKKRLDTAEIIISDNGNGIPDGEKDKIFDKFYCGDHKIADNRRSLGLGLYLCKSIINAHGGTIEVRDNNPKGAVFYFTLPLEEVSIYE